MNNIFGVILILGALVGGYNAFEKWQMLNNLGGLGELSAALGGPSKQDAVVQGVICVVAAAFGYALIDG